MTTSPDSAALSALGRILMAISMSCTLGAATVSEQIGANIHFVDPVPGEMDELAASGIGWLRIDIGWKETETAPGRYDFSAFDRLRALVEQKHLRIVHMLAYANPLYDGGRPPHTPEGRAAFAAWAAAAVAHYAGHEVRWEIWNEPNGENFWPPASDFAAYAALANAATAAIHAVAPHELVVGPAVSTIDTDYLEGVFRTGILAQWSGVTVHPYREALAPETASADFRDVRTLIRQWAPAGAQAPVLSGEWGYADIWKGYDVDRQARYLARMFLNNISAGIPISIWYDWRDDGTSPTDNENHFGLVHWQHDPAAAQPFAPKPAYRALATLTRELGASTFSKRFAGAADDHVLLFMQGSVPHLAAWSERSTPHGVLVPMEPGPVRVVDVFGAESTMTAGAEGLALTIDAGVRYLTPAAGDELLAIAAAWESVPQEWVLPAGIASEVSLHLRNPLARPIRITPGIGTDGGMIPPGGDLVWRAALTPPFDGAQVTCDLRCAVDGLGSITQHGVAVAANPLRAIGALTADGVSVRLDDLGASGFSGSVSCQPGMTKPVAIEPGKRTVDLAVADLGRGPWTATIGTQDGAVALVRHLDLLPLSTARWVSAPDGDGAIAGDATLQPASGCFPTQPALVMTWRKAEGWRFFRFAPATGPLALEGRPQTLTMWVRCLGAQPALCLRYQDVTGQTFQPIPHTLAGDPADWHCVAFRLDGMNTYHWGGANDGIVHAPIHLDTLLSVDHGRAAGAGTVEVQGPLLTW
jgi:hypothetical protein